MEPLPRNVYRHRTGFRGQRRIDGRNVRTATHATPQMAAAELEALLRGEDPAASTVDVAAELQRADAALAAAGAAVRRALLGTRSKHEGRA